MLAWVIGAGGMLGSAVTRRSGSHVEIFDAASVPWRSADAIAILLSELDRFRHDAGDEPWAVIWAAGSSIVASQADETADELETLRALLQNVAADPPPGTGGVFLTSSAGGVFAGSADPPFTIDTVPVPVSPYGRLKLDQERAAIETLQGRVPLAIGRIANLYGPDFNAAKAQGLIQQLCLATLRRRPLNLYVSMDTVRDYVFVDDAADAVWTMVGRLLRDQPADPLMAVIATGQPATVAQVIATVENVAHRRVPLALGTHPSARHQVIDLRLMPTMAVLDDVVATPLPTGVKRIVDALAGRVA